jgi:hypothetical protein
MAVNALTAFFDIREGSITLACDNSSAIRMTSYEPLGTNPSSCAQFDLVMAIQQAKTTCLTWIHKHVKGHQDDHPDLVLTPLEELNVDMDKKAKEHWTRTHSMGDDERIHDFVHQPWSISLGGQKVVSNLAATCKDWCQRPRIHGYWISKGRFAPEEVNNIEFKTAGAALKREQPNMRRWVTKLSSGYCGVNKWMFRWKQRDSEACPQCQHPLEDVQHMWLCQGKESPQHWVTALTTLELELRRLQTDPVVAALIISRLRTWQASADAHAFPELQTKYIAVLQRQDAQGWHNFWMGLPCQGWQQLQDDHYNRISSPKTGSSWLISTIRKQWLIAWDIWDYRNRVVHDSDEGIDAQRISTAIRAEYALGAPSREIRKFFRHPIQVLLKSNIDYQNNWLHRITVHRARTHRKDNSLRRSQACMAAFLGRR